MKSNTLQTVGSIVNISLFLSVTWRNLKKHVVTPLCFQHLCSASTGNLSPVPASGTAAMERGLEGAALVHVKDHQKVVVVMTSQVRPSGYFLPPPKLASPMGSGNRIL